MKIQFTKNYHKTFLLADCPQVNISILSARHQHPPRLAQIQARYLFCVGFYFICKTQNTQFTGGLAVTMSVCKCRIGGLKQSRERMRFATDISYIFIWRECKSASGDTRTNGGHRNANSPTARNLAQRFYGNCDKARPVHATYIFSLLIF